MHQNDWNSIIREGFAMPIIPEDATLDQTVGIAVHAAATHLGASTSVREYLEALRKGPGTNCPDSPVEELQKYVEMQKGQINKSNPYLTVAFLRNFIMPVFAFEREIVCKAIESCSDATQYEKKVIALSATLAPHYDHMWAKQFIDVTAPYQALPDDAQKNYYERVLPHIAPKFDYTSFDVDASNTMTNRRTWALAYPEETAAIVELLTQAEALSKSEQQTEMKAYFVALKHAHACTDIDHLESCWEAVDRAWIRIPPTIRVMPVHGMESGYEHPVAVSPELRLEIRTTQMLKEIDARRTGTIAHASALGLAPNLIDAAREHLGRIDIAVFCSAIRAGVSLNFRFSGQAVPNRQNVLAEGGRIFMDASNNERMTGIYRDTFIEHVTPETARSFSQYITADMMQIHTIDHELAHPVGRTPESDSAMGVHLMMNLEEAKASLLGVLADQWRAKGDPGYRAMLVALTTARLLRFMHKSTLENATADPYVRENRAAAFTLFETGIISLTPNGLHIDGEKAQSAVWFDALRKLNLAIIEAYASHDPHNLEPLTEQYCNLEHPQTVQLIEWVNR